MFGIIADVVIGLAFLIALIVGLARGFCRQFSRPLVGLISIIGGIALVAIIYPLIVGTGILDGFVAKAAGWFTKDFYTVQIDSVETLQATISDNYLRILSGHAEQFYGRMEGMLGGTNLEMTIGNFFGLTVVNVICEFGMWVILYLAIKYLLFGIKFLLEKITLVVVFKSIDKIFGLVWSMLWTYIIVIGVLLTTGEIVFAKFLPDLAEGFVDVINNSVLLTFFHGTNVLGSFVANILGMELLVVG
ncbi:MAG: hypothetical protein J1F65_03820 [Clostridiales bacterium]|nr:hypothetical protein [Clostridiales bacterium]